MQDLSFPLQSVTETYLLEKSGSINEPSVAQLVEAVYDQSNFKARIGFTATKVLQLD